MSSRQKIILIGNGSVGASYAFSMIHHEIGREIGIIDINVDKSEGNIMDLSHALPFSKPQKIYVADYKDCKDADIVVITAGLTPKPAGSRFDLIYKNVSVVRDVVNKVMLSGFCGVFIVATTPVDIISYAVYKFSGLPKNKVIGTGTLLDSARLRQVLSDTVQIDARNIHCYILGERGDSGFPVWSCTSVGGIPVENWCNRYSLDLKTISTQVKESGRDILDKKDTLCCGAAAALSRLTRAILHDENAVLPVSSYMDGEYGLDDLFISTPAILNKNGIREIINMPLNESEKEKMRFSAKIIKTSLKSIAHLLKN